MCKVNCLNILGFIFFFKVEVFSAKTQREDDICGEIKTKRIYLEFRESGILTAKNNDDTGIRTYSVDKEGSFRNECGLEIITCPSCILNIKFLHLNLSHEKCIKNSSISGCSCSNIYIYEPPFDDISGKLFCGDSLSNNYNLSYKSQIRSLVIVFTSLGNYDHAFTLEYISQRNRRFITASLNDTLMDENKIITSPFFPRSYPRDLSLEYVISCTDNVKCLIRLIFTDFQISVTSFIEFFDSNGQRLFVTTGNSFRPPIIFTSGPTLTVRFYANGGTNIGFKANYYLIRDDISNYSFPINQNCGGYVDNLGGGITMINMVKEGKKLFDCFWIIKPPDSFVHLKTHLYLKIVKFSSFGGKTELIVRQGITSNEPILEMIDFPQNNFKMTKECVVPISQGFYVSLKGIFDVNSSLAIMYSAFNYQECFAFSDFLCQNHRCIPSYLMCDGYDHCGDSSDEFLDCKKTYVDRKWMHKSNFYFPKLDKSEDLKTATLIFIACSIGLIALIFALIVLLYKVNNRTRSQFQIQTHLQTINDLLEENNQVEEEVIINDIPPNYEAPPEYADIIKIVKRKESRRKRKSLCSVESRKRYFQSINNLIDERPVSSLNSECSSISSYNPLLNSRSSQTTPLPSHVPKSPPPPYSNDKEQTVIAASTSQKISNEREQNLNEIIPSTSDENSSSFHNNTNSNNGIITEELSRIFYTRKEIKLYKCFSDGKLNYLKKNEELIKKENLYLKKTRAKSYEHIPFNFN